MKNTTEIRARLSEIEARGESLAAELSAARETLARAMATGDDTAKARARVMELTIELESIPAALDVLRSDLGDAIAGDIENRYAERHRKHADAVKALSKAGEELERAIAVYNEAATAPDLLPGHGNFQTPGRVAVPNWRGYLTSAEGRYKNDLATAQANARRKVRETSTTIEAFAADDSGHLRPITAPNGRGLSTGGMQSAEEVASA